MFEKTLTKANSECIDLLVFPETCYTPYENVYYGIDILNDNDNEAVRNQTLKISEQAGCAVIIGGMDQYGMIFSSYANAFACDGETETSVYFKQTMADDSPLGLSDYEDCISTFFECCILKGMRIGMTICYDCNHAAFSRAYAVDGVDILVNSTGGNVVYKKWYRYNKVRALENGCFNFCTMGYSDNGKDNSYCFGFTPHGKLMTGKPLMIGDRIGNIFVYDTFNTDKGYENDLSLLQSETANRTGYQIDPKKINGLLQTAVAIADNLYVINTNRTNIVFCMTDGNDILKPEKILEMLYHPELKVIENKKYLIVNRFDKLEENYYRTVLSDVLKVRSMENFCAVLLLSDRFSKCYQCGCNRTAQVVSLENGVYTLDLTRMGGPEVIWKNKQGMKACWRKGYENLIAYVKGIHKDKLS